MITKDDLKEEEVLCPKCEGSGYKYDQLDPNDPKYDSSMDYYNPRCDQCYGAGKLDWIEVLVGKVDPMLFQLPKLRKVYPALLAKELVSVQPMEKFSLIEIFKLKMRTKNK